MIPYPVERSTSWTPPSKKSSGRFPPPSSPSEDFEEFVHISQTHLSTSSNPNGLPTSPLKHLAQKVFPSLRPVRAQDFEERALQAREDDARRGRAFRHAEGVNERAEGWRREERELASGERGRFGSSSMTHPHSFEAALEPSASRRSRSPRLRAHQPLQNPDFLAPPTRPSIRPVQPQARPHSSSHPNLLPITQSSTRSGHFHIDSSFNSHCSSSPSVQLQTQNVNHDGLHHLPTRRSSHHNDQPRPTRHSGDLKDREYVVRKRGLLTHPVDAIRQGRVRRGGEEVFGSEEESSGAGSFVGEVERNRITPYVYDQDRGATNQYEVEERTPALSMSSSRSPSFNSESFGELFERLREEKGEEIGETWFRFSKDGHVEVDTAEKIYSPILIERSDSRASRSPGREIIFRDVSRAPPLIYRSSSSSPTLHVGYRPILHRSAHSFPTPSIWERQSFNPPTSISDSQLTSSLTYNHLGRPIKLSTPSPLSRAVSPSPPTRTPTSALTVNLNQASFSAFDDWEHISSPLDEKKTFVGIGKLGVESEEWEKRGKWIGWKQRGDWVDWASKKKEKKEERKQRWCRRSEEFVYDY